MLMLKAAQRHRHYCEVATGIFTWAIARDRALVLWFPFISRADWADASKTARKEIRLFRIAADAIWYSDGLRLDTEL